MYQTTEPTIGQIRWLRRQNRCLNARLAAATAKLRVLLEADEHGVTLAAGPEERCGEAAGRDEAMARTWRDEAMPLVAESIKQGRDLGLSGKDLVRHCNEQFPWGARENHPYQIWKSEVKRQLGIRKACDKAAPLFDWAGS